MLAEPHYITRVQCAVPENLFLRIHPYLIERADLQLLPRPIESGKELLAALAESRPDILILDLNLPLLDRAATYCALAERRVPPYLLASAATFGQPLLEAQGQRIVKGTLLQRHLSSALLPPVLRGLARGFEYFVPDPVFNLQRRFDAEELLLLSLMACGLEPQEIADELLGSLNKVYLAQSQLRRKLDVQTNEKAILMGVQRKLVTMPLPPDVRLYPESA